MMQNTAAPLAAVTCWGVYYNRAAFAAGFLFFQDTDQSVHAKYI